MFSLVLTAIEQAVHWFSADEDLGEWDTAGATAAHEQIAAAVARGDRRKAERLMRRHLEAFESAADAAGMLDRPLLPRARWSPRPSGAFGAM
jgi:DNA-binding FadR family transcriptional regulator